MLEQQVDHLLPGLVVGLVQAELLEVLVLADEVGRWVRQQVEEPLEVLSGERVVQVANDVELDATVTEDLLRPA